MKRMRRVHDLWNWLPAFRVVAETEHLPTASEQLHVSPSALSRSVRLLEDEVGHPLFHRVGRNLRLNDAGEALLSSVRDAMRRVDEGIAIASGARLLGPVHIAATENALPGVTDAIPALMRAHPELIIHTYARSRAEVAGLLLTGQLDVAVVDQRIDHARLDCIPLTILQNSVYASADHPLGGKSRPREADLLSHHYAVPRRGDDEAPVDPWPEEVPRNVRLTFTRYQVGATHAQRGEVMVVLPDTIANRHFPDLVRLHYAKLRATPLYALRRPALVTGDKADIVLQFVRAALEPVPGA